VPFLRVIRDKRGYETTYLMDWYHESGRQRSRVLYAFRGPGGVRVGRLPLEPATMHELEVCYPAVTFDWRTIFSERQVIESGPDLRRRRPRREEAPSETTEQQAKPGPKVQTPAAPHPPIPSALEGETPEERIAFLTEWYPKVRERVEHRTTDPARREALLTLAERLNPSAWDVAALSEPLAHAAEALERLSRVLTRRRRRSGKRRTLAGEPEAAAANQSRETVEAANPSDDAGRSDAVADSVRGPVDPVDSPEEEPGNGLPDA
jgi:hypothetical protein